jgi:uncharacterized membrane protein YwzB
MIYLPFIAAFALASINLFERLVLKKKNIAIKPYMVIVIFVVGDNHVTFFVFFLECKPRSIFLRTILIFSLIILFSIIANLFNFFHSNGKNFLISNLQK